MARLTAQGLMQRCQSRGVATLFGAILSIVPAGTRSSAAPPEISVRVVGNAEVIYDWKRDRCDETDTPDAPPRAFRDYSGTVHLLAVQHTLRQFTGPSLDNVSHRCDVIRQSANDDRPSMYSDRQWLASPYTLDGRQILALVHNEFNGHLRPGLCPSRVYSRCWENSLTLVTSTDGGQTYTQPAAPANLVAALPYRYQGDVGFPIGYFQPSNIVELDGYYYALFRSAHYLSQEGGICLIRTKLLSDASSWRGWDGRDFTVAFADPYTSQIDDPRRHLCVTLKTALPWNMGGMIRDPTSGAFVLVTKGLVGGGQLPRGTTIGIWAAASYNLVDWSRPVLVLADPSGATSYGNPRESDQDPSLLDPTSKSRNFDVIGNKPYVYFVRSNPDRRPYDRRLMRVPVQISIAPQ
jgi:hypothetical protein